MQLTKVRNLLASLILISCFCFVQKANATHIIGGEITYECLADSQYLINLIIYRDCDNGIADFDDPAFLGIHDEGTFQMEYELSLNDRDTLTPIVADSCLIPPDICVETTNYSFIVNLPEPVGGFYFSYFECCRNDDIVNIINDEETGSIFLSYMSEEKYNDCGVSLMFTDWPPLAICVDEPINWDHGVDESTVEFGNEVRYRLCTPLNIPLTPFRVDSTPILDNVTNAEIFERYDSVQWEVGFSEDLMLDGTPNIAMDSLTGFITGVPQRLGRYVIGVCVEEYNVFGDLIGFVRRDFQYNVTDCDNTLACFDLDTVACFYEGEDYVINPSNCTPNTQDFLWELSYENSIVEQTTLENPSFTVLDTGVYTLLLISKPGTACSDSTASDIHIVLTDLTADFELFIDDCTAPTTNVTFVDRSTAYNRENIVSWEWEIDNVLRSNLDSFDLLLNNGREYEVTLTVYTEDGCSATHSDSLSILPLDDVDDFDDVYVCEGDIAELHPNFNPDYFYTWRTFDNDTFSTDPNPSLMIFQDTCFLVTVSSSRNLGCFVEDTLCVNFISDDGNPTITCTVIDATEGIVIFTCDGENCDVYTLCPNDPLHPDSMITDFPYTHDYGPDQEEYCGEFKPDVEAIVCGLDTLKCQGDIIPPCCDYDLEWTLVECTDSITVNFAWDTICPTDSFVIVIDGMEYRELDFDVVFENEDFPLNVDYRIYLTHCIDTDSSFVIELDTLSYPLLSDVEKCPGDSVELNPNGPVDFDFVWTPGTGLSDRNAANPTACPSENTLYTVVITDPETGCFFEREVFVEILDAPVIDVPETIPVCDNEFEYCIDDLNGLQLEWSCDEDFSDIISTDSCVTLTYDGTKDFLYVRATSDDGCTTVERIELVDYRIDVSFEAIIDLCEGDTVKVTIEDLNGNIIDWEYDDRILEDLGDGCFLVTADEDIDIEVTARNEFCELSFNIFIDVFENDHSVEASASPATVNKGQTTQLLATTTGSVSVSWSPAESIITDNNILDPIAEPTEPTTYTVYSEDARGCDAFDTVFVDFTCLCVEPFIFVPNAFTPNSDNLNETYNVVAPQDLIDEMSLFIYNRWGELVFQTDDLNVGWDGTHNGDLVNPDVYAIHLNIKCFGVEEEFVKVDNVTVLY